MIRLIVALALACSCSAALAQKKMYRCGNQFQERPCEGPKSDATSAAVAKSDPQQQQDAAAKRQEREQSIRQSKCENYTEELGDIDKRMKAGADDRVMDQYQRRQKEMNIRIARECK